MDTTKTPASGDDANEPASRAKPRMIDSEVLLRGDREVRIVHGSDIYRLCVTHNGRLILTK